MQNFKFIKPYPLFKVECEEVVSRNDSKSTVFSIYVKIAKKMDWVLLYTTYSLGWAQVALNRLREIFDIWIIKFITEEKLPPMFEVNGEVYKTQYIFVKQSCICGKQIAGNQRYSEFAIDSIKFDYVRDIIFFYDEGTCLVKGNQLFIDGELKYNSKELKELCDNIGQDWSYLDSSPDKLIAYLKENYKNYKRYCCNGYLSFK